MGINFVAGSDDPAEVVQGGERAFDLPTLSVTRELPAGLRRLADATFGVREDQFYPTLCAPRAQRFAIRGPVVNEPRRDAVSHCLMQQRLYEVHLSVVGHFDLGRYGNAVAVGEYQALGPFAPTGPSDATPLFIRGERAIGEVFLPVDLARLV